MSSIIRFYVIEDGNNERELGEENLKGTFILIDGFNLSMSWITLTSIKVTSTRHLKQNSAYYMGTHNLKLILIYSVYITKDD